MLFVIYYVEFLVLLCNLCAYLYSLTHLQILWMPLRVFAIWLRTFLNKASYVLVHLLSTVGLFH